MNVSTNWNLFQILKSMFLQRNVLILWNFFPSNMTKWNLAYLNTVDVTYFVSSLDLCVSLDISSCCPRMFISFNNSSRFFPAKYKTAIFTDCIMHTWYEQYSDSMDAVLYENPFCHFYFLHPSSDEICYSTAMSTSLFVQSLINIRFLYVTLNGWDNFHV